MILSCRCEYPEQDKLHGKGRRVHTEGAKKGSRVECRCTVCGKVKQIG